MGQLMKVALTLLVDDVNTTVEFYRDVLGFEVVTTMPKIGWYSWAIVRYGSVEIMFESKTKTRSRSPFSTIPTCFIPVQGIENLYAHLKDRAPLIQPLQSTVYDGKDFVLRDCNGIYLTFAEGT